MQHLLILQFVALSIYTVFVGFTFCDGFKLRTGRKIIWFLFFLVVNIFVLRYTGQFALSMILPLPTLLALALCRLEQRQQKKAA